MVSPGGGVRAPERRIHESTLLTKPKGIAIPLMLENSAKNFATALKVFASRSGGRIFFGSWHKKFKHWQQNVWERRQNFWDKGQTALGVSH